MTHDEHVAELLDAASDPVRLKLIFLVAEKGPMNVGDIAGHFELSRPAVSHHLKILRTSGVLRKEKRGKEVFYRLNRSHLVQTLRDLADAIENCCPPDA